MWRTRRHNTMFTRSGGSERVRLLCSILSFSSIHQRNEFIKTSTMTVPTTFCELGTTSTTPVPSVPYLQLEKDRTIPPLSDSAYQSSNVKGLVVPQKPQPQSVVTQREVGFRSRLNPPIPQDDYDDDDHTASTLDTEATGQSNPLSTRRRGMKVLDNIAFVPFGSHSSVSQEPLETVPGTTSSDSSSSSYYTPKQILHTPLKSALRRRSEAPERTSITRLKPGANTQRRVRGLWNDRAKIITDPFAALRDETIQHVFSFLSLWEMGNIARTSRRFRHVGSTLPSSWTTVDATEFVQRVSSRQMSGDARFTTEALSRILTNHASSIESLTIRNIGDKLAPEFLYIPPNLKRLELSDFTTLTDTHWHVLLLTSSATSAPSSAGIHINTVRGSVKAPNLHANPVRITGYHRLERVKLSSCQHISENALRSVVSTCPNLQELVLENCPGIQNLDYLSPAWKRQSAVSVPRASRLQPSQSKQQPSPAMLNMFAPPPPRTSLHNVSDPSTPPQSRPSAALAALFAPPGTSPPHRKNSLVVSGNLTRVQLVNMTISSKTALLQSLQAVPGKVQLESLIIRYKLGEVASPQPESTEWTREDLLCLTGLLDPIHLQELDIPMETSMAPAGMLLPASDILAMAISRKDLGKFTS
jgi:hypothetical protein